MHLLELKHITHKFKKPDSKETNTVLNNINIIFPPTGLVSILGKSGCGKSTLLNIIASISKPTSGKVLFAGKDINKFNKNEKQSYLNQLVGIVFQHYHLFEDKDVMFNIALPSLISGMKLDNIKKDIFNFLIELNINEDFAYKKVKDLSGGEKQRVAVLRAIMNSPKMLLCDEPTGALDSSNSKIIMNMLKVASKTRLVILVSHNKELVNEYSDRIIYMKDGSIIKYEKKSEIKESKIIIKYPKPRSSSYWIEQISQQNIKKHFKRNIFSIIVTTICLVATTLIMGFSISSPEAIAVESKKHFDYGVLSISKVEKSDIGNSILSLSQESRPSFKKINELKVKYNELTFTYNYDILLPQSLIYHYQDVSLPDLLIRPIYDFSSPYIDESFLIKGVMAKSDNFDEIVVNKKGYEYIQNIIGKDPLGEKINLNYFYESKYYTFDVNNTILSDVFAFDKDFIIKGVVDELDFLSSPTVYYPYKEFINYLKSYYLKSLSEYYNRKISWKDRIDESSENDELSSYSIKAFLNDYHNVPVLKEIIEEINKEEVSATSLAINIEESLTSLIDASIKGMEIFLIISIIGLVLIIGIISFFSYSEGRKQSAVLSSLGALNSSITSLYVYESIIVTFISFFVSVALSLPLIKLGNYLLAKYLNLHNLISFPMKVLSSFKLDYLLIELVVIIIIVILASVIPIWFSKKIDISKELKEE